MNQNQQTCIILFAKFPAQGMAKTRLQPALGIEGAAQIAHKLLLHSIEQAVATGFTVELCVSPAPTDPCWQLLNLPDSLHCSAQAEGDLGLRMLTASQQALAHFEHVILIGTDCPSLTTIRIRQAAQQLETQDSVMIPAFDGGYALFGFKQVAARLFSNIEWSTASVAKVTQQRLAELSWSVALLAPLPDIDEPEDLQYLPNGWLDGYKVIKN
ncbi:MULTISPECIES: TIGR04282 family arsenosugar biosynthesis glycosyltransferase [unclassified Psychrobacter]|uniref:TIGR04282 family arsenosugar biosynthesis glycosyltransferase n=1 Tax=unclassified Psychrobacter TaxID=196806 RepID=UPI001918F4AB|nr:MULTISPECIES: TIGR04282 family arsenosugar biosynthesis glycosyltransferase [unclassified Psychrobacter]